MSTSKSSIESVILSREGYGEINRICKFISSLIIKNQAEADKYENEFTYNNYLSYRSAYTEANSVINFPYNRDDLKDFFDQEMIDNYDLMDRATVSDLILKGHSQAIKFMKFLQKRSLENYVEYNQYYKQFLGIPRDTDDNILVENLDHEIEGEFVPIHTVYRNSSSFPKTYDLFFVKRNIENLIQDNPDVDFLKFIENPVTPYFLRTSPLFTILYSDNTILEEEERKRFFKAYEKARIYISEQLYIKGQAKRFPLYGNMIIMLVLYYTFCIYFNLKLEDYSLRRYTRYDIYDLLESNGLANLKQISDLEILRKIVYRLDELNQYKGTEQVLHIIFEILNDATVVVKRYNIIKDYRTSNSGTLDIDDTGMYVDSVDLKFIEVPIVVNEKNTVETNNNKETDYDSKTYNDNLWGGIDPGTSESTKVNIKNNLKRDILGLDFNTLKTKYIGIAKAMNMFEKSSNTTNLMYMILTHSFDILGDSNPMLSERVVAMDIDMSPVCAFALFNYLTNCLNELDEPWNISHDRNFLSSINLVRSVGGLEQQLPYIRNMEVDLGHPFLKKTIGELIPDDNELRSYLTTFKVGSATTLSQLLEEYEKSKPIVDKIKEKILNATNFEEYQLFKTLYDCNVTSYDFTHIFDGYSDYREYFKDNNKVLYTHLESFLRPVISKTVPAVPYLWSTVEQVVSVLEEYFNKLLKDTTYYFSLSTAKEDNRYLNDLRILLREYLSIFSELYSVEKTYVLDDSPNNVLRFYDRIASLIMRRELRTKLNLREKIAKLTSRRYLDTQVSFREKFKTTIIKYFRGEEDTLTWQDAILKFKRYIGLNTTIKIKDWLYTKSKLKYKESLQLFDNIVIKEKR